MSTMGSPGISPKLREITKEISLFESDTKDSGFCEDPHEDPRNLINSPLDLLEDNETTMCFSPQRAFDDTPNRRLLSSNKKRLFVSPIESPSMVAAGSLKRLKIFDFENNGSSVLLDNLDFTDKVLDESENDEVPSLDDPIRQAQKDFMKEAVEKSDNQNLIGDFSKNYALPVITGSHPDLKCISVDTMKDILEGKFDQVINSVKIIDSRYPYEYEGGHIKGALNIYTMDDCLKLLEKPVKSKMERHILIFHCEFSKERGPNMIRNLRQEDRNRNTQNYPALIYPEIYVLEGGYKKFYNAFPEHCVPMEYKQMLHPAHADEMRFFKKKSKTSESILKTSKKKPPISRSSKAVRKTLSNNF